MNRTSVCYKFSGRAGSNPMSLANRDEEGDYRTALVDTWGQVPTYGGRTAYVERTNLTSRQMNGRLVRKTLSYSKQLVALNAACAWEDWVYNLTRSVDTLSLPMQIGQQRWKRQTPAMAAKLTDHIWSIKELLMTIVPPRIVNN